MKIGILVAMEEEFNPLCQALVNECKEEKTSGNKLIPDQFMYIKHSDVFYTFNIYGHEIFLILSGIGINNAQLATSFLVMTNKVDLVLNYGLAGATNQFSIGQIVSGIASFNMDFDLTELGRQQFEVPGVGQSIPCANSNEIEKMMFDRAPIFSSNQFVSKKYAKARKISKGVFDMELYGIAFACAAYKIPVMSIKIISDNMSSKQFDGSILDLTDRLAKYIMEILRMDIKLKAGDSK